MADIFLSYTEKDRDEARRIAATLESVGWTVWWDRRIPAGETWREVLEQALEQMRCMVVLWSTRSIGSECVCEEATEGRRQRKLVPVLIEAVRPPAGFREIQAADLTQWDGSLEFEGMRLLIADLERFLGKPAPSPVTARSGSPVRPGETATGRRSRRGLLAAGIAVAILLATGAIHFRRPAPESAVAVAFPVPAAPQAEAAASGPPVAVTRPASSPRLDPMPPVPSVPVRPASAAVSAMSVTKERVPAARLDGAPARSSRCADLVARIQLGEALSGETRRLFQQECRQ